MILAAANDINHTNYGELRRLFQTFTRVWESGEQTSLHLNTQNGQTKAKFLLSHSIPGEKQQAPTFEPSEVYVIFSNVETRNIQKQN